MDEEILEVIDQEMQVCGCGKCEECRARELALVVGECTCIYEDVIKQDEEGNEYTERVLVTQCDYHNTIDTINLKYDNYRLMGKANINQDLWDLCKVVDGVIYTPQVEVSTEKSLGEKVGELDTRVSITEEAVLGLLVASMKLQ